MVNWKEDLVQSFEGLDSIYIDETKKITFKKLFEELGNWRDRSRLPWHLSASCLVFHDNKLAMVFHPYQKEWLLPAGHVDGEEMPLEAAIREFEEETGGRVAKAGQLVDVNWIPIPENTAKAEPGHHHLDFRYLFEIYQMPDDNLAELSWAWVAKEECPEEFKIYFDLIGG